MPDLSRYLVVLLLLTATPARAHNLTVFAFAEDGRIDGYAHFAGGTRASGIPFSIHGATGRLLLEGITDERGEFSYRPLVREDIQVEIRGGDGHQAIWRLRAEELVGVPEPTSASAPKTSATCADPTPDELEQAVARQLRPLREELRNWREQASVTEVIGGIGYIFGIAGLAMWWHASRNGRRP